MDEEGKEELEDQRKILRQNDPPKVKRETALFTIT